jgi:hypothetical protein
MAVGKTLPGAFYLHSSALALQPTPLQQLEQRARQVVPGVVATLVKFKFRRPQIAYLHYPDFDTDPHPALHSSILVDLARLTATTRSYQERPNPPILHRKETFVAPDYPGYADFVHLTQQEIHQGLLDHPRTIGLRRGWQQRLQSLGLEIYPQGLACALTAAPPEPPAPIQRHRAAIARVTASKPLRLALEAGLIPPVAATLTTAAATAWMWSTCTGWAIAARAGIPTFAPTVPASPPMWSTWPTSSTSSKTPASAVRP